MKKISIVVAVSQNSMIGQDNKLLWHLPNDLKHFKALTLHKSVIMGRKTFEAIGRPLVERQNIVLTRGQKSIPGVSVVHSVEQALAVSQSNEIMVIGGGEIYECFLPLATRLYVTKVHVQQAGDTSFTFNKQDWQLMNTQHFYRDEKHAYDYSFYLYERITH